MSKKHKSILIVFSIILLLLLMFTCTLPAVSKHKSKSKKHSRSFKKTGTINFSFGSKTNSSKALKNYFTKSGASPKFILVSVKSSANGSLVLNKYRIELFNNNGEYISTNIMLDEGAYQLTEFVVIDETNSIIYVTPIEGSANTGLVNDPLPINFSVSSNNITMVNPEVISVTGSLSGYGYVSFTFNIKEENLIKNGDFSNGLNNWELFFNKENNASVGPLEIVNGELKVPINNGGFFVWDVGIAQTYFNLQNTKIYSFKFRARTTSTNQTSVKIVFQKQSPSWTAYAEKTFIITQNMETYSYDFTVNVNDSQAGFNFHLGTNSGDIYIDDVCLFASNINDPALDPYTQAQALGKGVNFGNLLDAYPQEGSWSGGRIIMESDFDRAKSIGFDSVRIPIRFSNYALFNSPYTINETFMARVDEVVNWGLSKGLRIIIVMHHYRNDDNPGDSYNDINIYPEENRARFIAMWKQIAARYSGYSENLYYELLNEPNTNLTVEVWNSILTDCIYGIRQVDNFHTIIVDCANWSNISGLNGLNIPVSEKNAIVTFHYYNPILFCNQGKSWSGSDCALISGIVWPRTPGVQVTPVEGLSQWAINWINNYNTIEDDEWNPAGHGVISREIQEAANWGYSNNRPLWMSEFTVHNGRNDTDDSRAGDIASRARWIEFVRMQLEENNIPWSYWSQFTDDCYLYDGSTNSWITELTQALGL